MFDIDKKKKELNLLEQKAGSPDFWSDSNKARSVMEEMSNLRETIEKINKVQDKYEELLILNELAVTEEDEHLSHEFNEEFEKLVKEIESLEIESWFTGEFDTHDAIVSIHPGAGGTESQDWAEMLLRMYLRWAERRGFHSEINELWPGDEAGIKSVTFTIHGRYAYGLMEAEKGVHRLVRISPFDSSKRRHTSFASVDVIPAIEDEIEIIIDPKDLRIETYRSSGAGGQHVNVTDSAVRITHLPTGIVAQCQNERSQLSNRETAMKILKARLFKYEQEKKEEELAKLYGEKKEIAWGSQIRSYVFHPYSLVKDHRTNFEKGNVQGVMDGDIDEFIVAYLETKSRNE
ncbi:MAG: peptide chain release factor 2 [Actinobacteria bacterium]|nr:peptide chain release factor 2 [Actinomycetota bacterium]